MFFFDEAKGIFRITASANKQYRTYQYIGQKPVGKDKMDNSRQESQLDFK